MKFYEWLNQIFWWLDAPIFRAVNEIANNCPWISKFARFVSYFGDEGIFFIIMVLCFIIFRKTRKMGIVLAIGMIISTLLNNVLLKNIVARPRPYDEVLEFKLMWEAHSGVLMHSFSFPSGHTTTAAVIGVGLFILNNKKFSWAFLLIPLLMGWSRIALFVHYPSDVLFGLIVGSISIISSYFLSKLLFKWKLLDNVTKGDKLF